MQQSMSPVANDSPLDDSLDSECLAQPMQPAALQLINAAEIATKRTEEHFFSNEKKIDELFPDTTGNIRLAAIFKVYAVPDAEARHKLNFFDASGKPTMEKASCNQRANYAVKENYKKGILQKGLINGVRGDPWIIKSAVEGKPHQCLTFGTLTSAIYELAADPKHKTNRFLNQTLLGGLPNVVFLRSRIPPVVQAWLRDFHNQFAGSRLTICDLLDVCSDAESAWKARRVLTGLSSRSCIYQAEMYKFVRDNFESAFKSENSFQQIKALLSQVKRWELDCHLKEMSDKIDYMRPDIPDTETMLHVCHDVISLIEGHASAWWPNNVVCLLIVEALSFCLPQITVGGPTTAHSARPWRIITSKCAAAKCQAFRVPMVGSKAYSPGKRPSKQKNDTLPQLAETMLTTIESLRKDSTREVTFLDDMVLCTKAVVDSWYKELLPEDTETAYRDVFATSLEFAWAGTITIGGKQITKWSALRPAMKLHTTKALKEKNGMDAGDVGANLLQILQEEESDSLAADSDDPALVFNLLASSYKDGAFDELKKFIETWSLAQFERHPLFNDMMGKIWSDPKGAEMNVETFVAGIEKHVACYVSHDWVWFCWQITMLMRNGYDFKSLGSLPLATRLWL